MPLGPGLGQGITMFLLMPTFAGPEPIGQPSACIRAPAWPSCPRDAGPPGARLTSLALVAAMQCQPPTTGGKYRGEDRLSFPTQGLLIEIEPHENLAGLEMSPPTWVTNGITIEMLIEPLGPQYTGLAHQCRRRLPRASGHPGERPGATHPSQESARTTWQTNLTL